MSTVTVIAEKENHELYKSFSLEGKTINTCSLNNAIVFTQQNRSDLILLDCGFDVENGLQLLKELKGFHPRTPIIFLADSGSDDIVLKAFKKGARDFFKKPVNIFELQETVNGIISVKKEAKENRHPFRNFINPEELLRKVTTNQPVTLIRAIRYIDLNFQKKISLEELANEANVSKYHFCRLFKKHIGISPMKFVLSKKIIKAKELLRRENLNISMVAAEVGFNDISSFIEQFKKFTGITPTNYKKSLRE